MHTKNERRQSAAVDEASLAADSVRSATADTTDGNGEHYGMGNCHTPFCGSFDDQAWWALAWAKAYELTGDTQYRLRSGQIFEYLAENSWDDTACGGGCW